MMTKTLLKKPKDSQKGLKKLPTAVRNKMGYAKKGTSMKKEGVHKMPDGSIMKNSEMKSKKAMYGKTTKAKSGAKMKKAMMGNMVKPMMKSGGKMPMKKMIGGGKCRSGC